MQKQMSGFLSGKQKALSNSEADMHTDHDHELSSSLDKVDLEMPVTLMGTEWANASENSDVDDGIEHDTVHQVGMMLDRDVDDSTATVCASSPTWVDKVRGVSTGVADGNSGSPVRPDSWGSKPVTFGGTAMRHKSEVPLIFLAYH